MSGRRRCGSAAPTTSRRSPRPRPARSAPARSCSPRTGCADAAARPRRPAATPVARRPTGSGVRTRRRPGRRACAAADRPVAVLGAVVADPGRRPPSTTPAPAARQPAANISASSTVGAVVVVAAVRRGVGGVDTRPDHGGLMAHHVDPGQQRRQPSGVPDVDLVERRRAVGVVAPCARGQHGVDADDVVARRPSAPRRTRGADEPRGTGERGPSRQLEGQLRRRRAPGSGCRCLRPQPGRWPRAPAA